MYARLLKVTGGRERIAACGDEIGSSPGDIPALHRRKTDIYNERIRSGGIALRPGVERLIRTAREHDLPLAIATTTSRPNVISLVAATLGKSAVGWFASIRTGEDVLRKKPDPEVFNLVLADLGLAAADCVAFEDSANGLKAALAAGIPTIVTPSIYTQAEDFAAAALVLRDLDEPGEAWMRRLERFPLHSNRKPLSILCLIALLIRKPRNSPAFARPCFSGSALIHRHDDSPDPDQADADPCLPG
jgi:HAD superfamily hydrolase (TIGR01509 family)